MNCGRENIWWYVWQGIGLNLQNINGFFKNWASKLTLISSYSWPSDEQGKLSLIFLILTGWFYRHCKVVPDSVNWSSLFFLYKWWEWWWEQYSMGPKYPALKYCVSIWYICGSGTYILWIRDTSNGHNEIIFLLFFICLEWCILCCKD